MLVVFSVHGCLFSGILVLLLCAGARRHVARGRVLIVYTGAGSLGVPGCLALPLRDTGRRCLATVFGRFMPVIVLIAHGACHSVALHGSNYYLNYCSYVQCYLDYLLLLIFIVNGLLLFVSYLLVQCSVLAFVSFACL